jgi:hypothetical protein
LKQRVRGYEVVNGDFRRILMSPRGGWIGESAHL